MRKIFVLACALGAMGCEGAPADVSGTYTVALTNTENGCMFDWWDPTAMSTGTSVVATQVDESVRLEVTDLFSSAALNAVLGDDTFTGVVSGNHVSAEILGTVNLNEGGCGTPYRVKATLEGDLTGDTLAGDITYEPLSFDCFTNGCTNVTLFNGARPPTE